MSDSSTENEFLLFDSEEFSDDANGPSTPVYNDESAEPVKSEPHSPVRVKAERREFKRSSSHDDSSTSSMDSGTETPKQFVKSEPSPAASVKREEPARASPALSDSSDEFSFDNTPITPVPPTKTVKKVRKKRVRRVRKRKRLRSRATAEPTPTNTPSRSPTPPDSPPPEKSHTRAPKPFVSSSLPDWMNQTSFLKKKTKNAPESSSSSSRHDRLDPRNKTSSTRNSSSHSSYSKSSQSNSRNTTTSSSRVKQEKENHSRRRHSQTIDIRSPSSSNNNHNNNNTYISLIDETDHHYDVALIGEFQQLQTNYGNLLNVIVRELQLLESSSRNNAMIKVQLKILDQKFASQSNLIQRLSSLENIIKKNVLPFVDNVDRYRWQTAIKTATEQQRLQQKVANMKQSSYNIFKQSPEYNYNNNTNNDSSFNSISSSLSTTQSSLYGNVSNLLQNNNNHFSSIANSVQDSFRSNQVRRKALSSSLSSLPTNASASAPSRQWQAIEQASVKPIIVEPAVKSVNLVSTMSSYTDPRDEVAVREQVALDLKQQARLAALENERALLLDGAAPFISAEPNQRSTTTSGVDSKRAGGAPSCPDSPPFAVPSADRKRKRDATDSRSNRERSRSSHRSSNDPRLLSSKRRRDERSNSSSSKEKSRNSSSRDPRKRHSSNSERRREQERRAKRDKQREYEARKRHRTVSPDHTRRVEAPSRASTPPSPFDDDFRNDLSPLSPTYRNHKVYNSPPRAPRPTTAPLLSSTNLSADPLLSNTNASTAALSIHTNPIRRRTGSRSASASAGGGESDDNVQFETLFRRNRERVGTPTPPPSPFQRPPTPPPPRS